jgi:hypothetical protein
MYGQTSKLKNKPLTKSLGPLFQQKLSKTTRKQFFYALLAILGPFGYPYQWTQESIQRPTSRRYVWSSKDENKRLTKSLGPFLQKKLSKATRKQFFFATFGHFGAILAPPNGPKKVARSHKWAECMAQCLSLEISP